MNRIRKFETTVVHAANRVADAIADAATWALHGVHRRSELALALFATLVFYYPSLRNRSIDAGFLYSGDVLGYHWPALVKAHAMFSSWQFTGIDFNMFNGATDWFVAVNFYGFHPLIVLYSLFTSPETTTMRDVGRALVWILAFQTFAACYFSLRLLTRFFAASFGVAAFAATGFAFSIFMLGSHNQPMFLFCGSVVPWVAYGALCFEQRPALWTLLWATLPVLISLLGGYMPLAAACLLFSILLVIASLTVRDEPVRPLRERMRCAAVAAAPFALASLIVSPFMAAIYSFYRDTPAFKVPDLFFAAHQLADLPQSLLRMLSIRYEVPGPVFEFSLWWGVVPVVITALFLLSRGTFEQLSPREWRLLKICAGAYFLTALSTFGQFSVVSDLVYYFIPQVGTMHIYQRFLLPAQLLLMLMVAVMLKALIRARPALSLRIALVTLAGLALASAYIVARQGALAQAIGISNYVVLELALGVLLVLALLMPGDRFAYTVAIVLALQPAFDSMYDLATGGNTLATQQSKHPVVLDAGEKARLLAYLKRFSDKALIKYVDITPLWTSGLETFPKSLAYLTLNELPLSSYNGFSFYVGTRADYSKHMPITGDVQAAPDWDWIEKTGADFVVARDSDLAGTGALASKLNEFKDVYRVPGGAVIVPLRAAGARRDPAVAFDNGYFRVVPYTGSDDPRKLQNIALRKPARQSSTGEGAAQLAVDGRTSGVMAEGSVASTGQDRNAWFEIDLGAVEPIQSVRVWNRTDGAGFRLRDYWLFISEQPFGDTDTAATLRTRPGVWSHINGMPNPSASILTPGVRGRYVRIQFGGTQPLEESWLSLAEVEVFRAAASPPAGPGGALTLRHADFTTNKANYLRLNVDVSAPATVQYLLWKNPRLSYYLDGERAAVVSHDELAEIHLPAGRHTIEVRYRNWPLLVFEWFYVLYAAACAGVGVVMLMALWRSRRRPRP